MIKEEINRYIREKSRKTIIKLECHGKFSDVFLPDDADIKSFKTANKIIMVGNKKEINEWLSKYSDQIDYYKEEYIREDRDIQGNRDYNNLSFKYEGDYIVDRDVLVGEGTIISENCIVGRHTIIGENCKLREGSIIAGGNTKDKGVTIGDYVTIGREVVILNGVTIGDHVTITEGSVVTDNINEYCVVSGIPASTIGYLCKNKHKSYND